jgi:hypothetical protein
MDKLVTGQKTSWGSFFEGLGTQLLNMSTQFAESQLFKMILGGATGGGSIAATGNEGAQASGNLFSTMLGSLIPHKDGGDVDPGHDYLVGEDGPEILRKTSGSIVPNKALGGSSTVSHTYHIDARGTDPVLTAQHVKAAVDASHKSAIATAGRVQSEKLKRTPQ